MFIFAGEIMLQNSETPAMKFCGFVLGNSQSTILGCPLSEAR